MIKDMVMSGHVDNYRLLANLLELLEPNEIRDIFKGIAKEMADYYYEISDGIQNHATAMAEVYEKYYQKYDRGRGRLNALPNPAIGCVYYLAGHTTNLEVSMDFIFREDRFRHSNANAYERWSFNMNHDFTDEHKRKIIEFFAEDF